MLVEGVLFTLCIISSIITGQAVTRQNVHAGEDVALQCTMAVVGDEKVMWFGPGNTVLFMGENRITSDSRFELRRRYSDSWNLVIRNTKAADAGSYTCKAQPPSKLDPKVFQLDVNKQAQILPSQSSKDQKIEEGGNVNITCIAEGFPVPKINWYKVDDNDETFLSSGQELSIPGIRREDTGVYRCTAFNGIGMNDTQDITIDVEYSPVILLQKIIAINERDIKLECAIEWNPVDKHSWTKDGELVEKNWKYTPQITQHNSSISLLILVVNQVEGPSDYGMYSCVAENKHGRARGTLPLNKSNVPSVTAPGKGNGGSKQNPACSSMTILLAVTVILNRNLKFFDV